MKKILVGWKLDVENRASLLRLLPPTFQEAIADHVTLGSAVSLPEKVSGQIVGRVSDGSGLEAMVVEIEGTTRRPDGKIFHITWSLDHNAGRRPIESNILLDNVMWQPFADPIHVGLIPAKLSK